MRKDTNLYLNVLSFLQLFTWNFLIIILLLVYLIEFC
jgi:hypothetical protein